MIGERRFLGLYTTAAYRESAREIPLLGAKVQRVLSASGFPSDSHDAKALVEILESYPRDSLFQARAEELYAIAMGVLALGERQRVRLFVRYDPLGRFAECLVCVPRDRFNTDHPRTDDGDPARCARRRPRSTGPCSPRSRCWHGCTSSSAARTASLTTSTPRARIPARGGGPGWEDGLRAALVAEHGEERGRELVARYGAAFPPAYRDELSAARGGRRHRAPRGARAPPEPVIVLARPVDAPEGDDPLQAVQRRAGLALRRAADVRAHGRRGRRRATLRDRSPRPRAGVDVRLRPARSTRGDRRAPRALPRRVPGRLVR